MLPESGWSRVRCSPLPAQQLDSQSLRAGDTDMHLTNSEKVFRSSSCGSVVMNPTRIHEDAGLIPDLTQWVKGSVVAMSCDVGHRCGSDLALLWCRLAAAALIQPLAWELPCAPGVALKRKKRAH